MTTAWAHLPNAQHIDWVLTDSKARPAVWFTASTEARDAAWGAARDAARGAARDAARGAVWDAVWGAAWIAARDAIRALIAYDDCGPLLDCSLEHLQRLYRLNPHPPFFLLQPAVIAKNTP
jgi:hypothetical protein